MTEWNAEQLIAWDKPGKGLTEGYVPLAITLISEKLFSAFNSSVAEGKALACRHSYTENALVTANLAVEALRASITEVWRCSNASTRKNAEEVTA